MTTDTEARLRAALRAGAELITVEPAAVPDASRVEERPVTRAQQRRARLVWAVAAAVIVVAVAALAVGLRARPDKAPPVHRPTVSPTGTTPSATPSGSRTVTGPAVGGIHPASCAAANGASWTTTPVTAPDAPRYDITGELALAGVDSHGSAVLVEQTRPNRVLLAAPSGHPTPLRRLYTAPLAVPGQGDARIGSGMVDGNWSVFSIITGGGQGAPAGIEAVNTVSGAVQDVRDTSLGTELILSAPVVVNGVVYWSENRNTGAGHIYAYDLATGTRRTLETGPDFGPFTVGGGVYWGDGTHPKQVVTYRAGTLPPGYAVAYATRASVVRAGDLVAWNRGTQIVVRRGSGPAVAVVAGTPVALVDDYLVYRHGTAAMSVLDLRTGATLALPEPGPFGLAAAGGAGTLAANTLGAHGGSNVTLVHVTTVPRLRC